MSKKTNKDKVKVKADYYFGDYKTQAEKLEEFFNNYAGARIAKVIKEFDGMDHSVIGEFKKQRVTQIRMEVDTMYQQALIKLQKRIAKFYNIKEEKQYV